MEQYKYKCKDCGHEFCDSNPLNCPKCPSEQFSIIGKCKPLPIGLIISIILCLLVLAFLFINKRSDCNGDSGGSAYIDNCGICVEGKTGKLPCTDAPDDSTDISQSSSSFVVNIEDPPMKGNDCSILLSVKIDTSLVKIENSRITVSLDGKKFIKEKLRWEYKEWKNGKKFYIKVEGYEKTEEYPIPTEYGQIKCLDPVDKTKIINAWSNWMKDGSSKSKRDDFRDLVKLDQPEIDLEGYPDVTEIQDLIFFIRFNPDLCNELIVKKDNIQVQNNKVVLIKIEKK